MAFPPKDPSAPPNPKVEWGKNKSRRYAVWYTSRKSGGADDTNWKVGEFKGQHIKSVHNAVVRQLRSTLGRPELKASDVLIMEAHLIPPFVTFEKYMDMLSPPAEEDGEE